MMSLAHADWASRRPMLEQAIEQRKSLQDLPDTLSLPEIRPAKDKAELREMGCGYGQGYLVARPMAAPSVEALIRTGTGESGPSSGASAKPGVPAA